MATIDWIGNAIDTPQIVTRTVAGTWATSDTLTGTINAKSLTVTVGTPFTVTDIATLFVAAFNSATRISDTTGSSNVGGQSIPEFAELIASNTAGVITFTTRNASEAGKDFTLTMTKSSTSGTISSETVIQAATGKNWWSNISNWSGGAIPVNDDTIRYLDSNVDCTRGLPNNSLEVMILIYNTFTARLGLPKVNRDNTSRPYSEYRQRYVRLDDAGTGGTALHKIGIGTGNGPKLVNIHQAALATTFEIESNNAVPSSEQTDRVINVIAPAGGMLKVRKGSSIDISDQDSASANWTAITISGKRGNLNEIDVLSRGNSSAACVANQTGGRLTLDWTAWTSNGLTLVGGETVVYTTAIPSADISEGALVDVGNGTIAASTLNRGGVFDVSRGSGTITTTNATYYAGAKVINPAKRITHTNAVALKGLIKDMDLDYGYNRTLQIAG